MNIRELERAVRAAVQQNPTQPALASLASDGYLAYGQSGEFDAAIMTMTERGLRAGGKSILKDIGAKWM